MSKTRTPRVLPVHVLKFAEIGHAALVEDHRLAVEHHVMIGEFGCQRGNPGYRR